MEKLKQNKKVLIGVGSALGALLLSVIIMLATVSSRVEGIWQRYTGYLPYYGTECVHTYVLSGDGTYTATVYEADTEAILKVETGVWSVSGFEVECRRPSQNGCTPFTFNPVTNKLINAGGFIPKEDDPVYKKIG